MGSFNISNAISSADLQILKNAAVDRGQAFLSNKITSSFVQISSFEPIQTLTAVAATGLGAAGAIKGISSKDGMEQLANQAANIMKSVVASAIKQMTKEATAVVTEYTSKHLAAIGALPGNVMKCAMQKFNEEKMSVGDVVKSITRHADELADADTEEAKNKQVTETIGKAKEKMGKVVETVNAYLKIGLQHVESVQAYIGEGPDWVQDQINKQINSVVTHVKDILDTQWNEKDKPWYDDTAHNIGDPTGEAMAATFNRNLEHVQKKLISKLDAQKAKGKTKLKTGVMGAVLKLAAKTGVL